MGGRRAGVCADPPARNQRGAMHKKAEEELDRQAGDLMDSITRIIVWWAVIGLAVFGACWLWNRYA